MADEQPPAEGEEPTAEETGSGAAEAAAEQGGNAAAEQGNEEQAAPDEAAPAVADESPAGDAPAEAPAAPEAPAEEAPAPATAEEPAGEEAAPAAGEEAAPAAAEAPAGAEAEPAEAATQAADAPAEDAAPAAAEASADESEADEKPAAGEPAEHRRQRPSAQTDESEPEVVPGAHLEPDLVLEESRPAEGEYDPYATDDDTPGAEGERTADEAPAPVARTPLDLAADARYRATGKRKRAVARVILKPGSGVYTINGKELDTYFPRVTLQRNARLPLETTGNATRMDVVAKIHGGGVSSQAIALRHGISRALVEADPNLRTELKRHGFLTRDARVKERKKAGLKKARKRPQFSKR